MYRSFNKSVSLAAGLALSVNALAAPPSTAWVTSWYASPQPVWTSDFLLPTNVPAFLDNQTVDETVRLSAGGKRVRLVFSNRYGREPVVLGRVRVAGASMEHNVTFGGQRSATVAAGKQITSDAIAMPVGPLSQLSVRSYFPQRTAVASFHWGGQQTIGLASGDWTSRARFMPESSAHGRLFLSGVLVEGVSEPRTVVVLGDSITDGNGSTPDLNRRWPDFLAERLAPRGIAVANAGISGARLLRDGMGVKALDRVEADVFSQPGVTDLILLLGTNDVGWPGSPFAPAEQPVSLEALAAGYSRLIALAHARGVRVVGATLPPFEGALEGTPFAGHYSPAKEQLRQQLNAWIRTQGAFDSVIDFDALLRDPVRPQRLKAAYDSGDHLHPGDAGYRAMADAVDTAALGHANPRSTKRAAGAAQ